eukprot:s5910_g5.t1
MPKTLEWSDFREKDFRLPSDTDDFAELLRSWWQDVYIEQTGRIRKCEKLLSGAYQCWALCTCVRKCTQTWKFYTDAPAPDADHVKFVWQTSGPHVPQPEDARSKANANRVAHLNPLAGAAQLIREGVPPAEMPDHHDLELARRRLMSKDEGKGSSLLPEWVQHVEARLPRPPDGSKK